MHIYRWPCIRNRLVQLGERKQSFLSHWQQHDAQASVEFYSFHEHDCGVAKMKMRKNVWHLVATCLAVARTMASKLDPSTNGRREARSAKRNLHSKEISAFASEVLYQRPQDASSMGSQNNRQQRSTGVALNNVAHHADTFFEKRQEYLWLQSRAHASVNVIWWLARHPGPTLLAPENSWSRMKQHVNHTSWPDLSQVKTDLQ